MKSISNIGLEDVKEVYNGAEGELWELVMGEQIHIGGFASSMDLATRAGIGDGMQGVDLCCCNGAGMRFLVRFRNVSKMTGIDATAKVVQSGRLRCLSEGSRDNIAFTLADVCDSDHPSASADFVWGEDAWCYVADKPRLISEAARIVKAGGIIAFTDWVEGPVAMTDAEAERMLKFMKFPNIATIDDYTQMLHDNGCAILHSADTGRFSPCIDLYLQMLSQQLTYDALRVIGFDTLLMGALGEEMAFMQKLVHEGKLIQAMFVAKKEQ